MKFVSPSTGLAFAIVLSTHAPARSNESVPARVTSPTQVTTPGDRVDARSNARGHLVHLAGLPAASHSPVSATSTVPANAHCADVVDHTELAPESTPANTGRSSTIPGAPSARATETTTPGSAPLLAPASNAPFLTGPPIIGPALFDNGNTAVPPDPGIAVGPDHLVTVVNRELQVWQRTGGTPLVDLTLATFFGAPASPSLGNPRVVRDAYSGRWFVTASDFTDTVWLAVSTTTDPTATWFVQPLLVSQGTDVGRSPDFPVLDVDEDAVYISARMLPTASTDGASIFVLEKAPLVSASPALGVVTAFRDLEPGSSIQPAREHAPAPGHYFVARDNNGIQLRVRQVSGPVTAPTLTLLGSVNVPMNTSPLTVSAVGSVTPIWLGTTDVFDADFSNGKLRVLQHMTIVNHVGVRWYEIDPSTLVTTSTGTISSASHDFYDPGFAVNSRGDMLFAFNASNPSDVISLYVTGHLGEDPNPSWAPVVLARGGEAIYERNDGAGLNRWGNHNTVVVDPMDQHVFWCFGEYARHGNRWGTAIVRFELGEPGLAFCAGDGLDPDVTTPCPCANFGAPGRGCANSIEPAGALLRSGGTNSNDDIVLEGAGMSQVGASVFIKGDGLEAGGVTFGDGVRCVGGTLVRLKSTTNVGGVAQFPDVGDPTLSTRGGTPVGSGLVGYYQVRYRNAAVAFCPPDTFNVTNALRVLW